MNARFFIFGAGYSGQAVAAASPEGFSLAGTTRSPARADALKAAGIAPHIFDGSLTQETGAALAQATHLLISIGPNETGDPVLNAARETIAALPALRWIGYLSTVGVYGDHGGAWVDEATECRPVSRRSGLRLEAELEWQELGRRTGLPVAIMRLSGIYGPGRNAFLNLQNGTARRIVKPDQVFNRIHGEDIAGAVWHLAGLEQGGIFNVTDDLPSPPQDVVAYAAALLGIEPPPETPFETAELSPMARSFYGENKRVRNDALKRSGYRLRYPDYRIAFDAMWLARNWKNGPARNAAGRG